MKTEINKAQNPFSRKPTPDEIIGRWTEAFRAANGTEPLPPPVYENGWFVFRRHFAVWRYRGKEIIEMAERNESLAAATPTKGGAND